MPLLRLLPLLAPFVPACCAILNAAPFIFVERTPPAGGVVGSGRQPMSWIGLDDAIGALHFLMINDQARGAFNVVAPHPATNRQFTHTLAAVLKRPVFASIPSVAIFFSGSIPGIGIFLSGSIPGIGIFSSGSIPGIGIFRQSAPFPPKTI